MIPYNFEYYQPASVHEAVSLYQALDVQKKQPLYFSGGTEIITGGRINLLYTGAVIDLKRIPECRVMVEREQNLHLGSALSLSELYDSRVFPLLGDTGAGVADRTSRNKITFGGNICSALFYREVVLPLLLTDSNVVIASPSGMKQAPILQLFDRTLLLQRGEFLIQSVTDHNYVNMPYMTIKKRKGSAIDYPLVTVSAIRTATEIRVAFSGVCAFPFRSEAVEAILNRQGTPLQKRIAEAVRSLPAPILSDMKGSAAYRELVLKNTLEDIMNRLGGE
jgi:CO/xanthine dehydrogenase FAD-binding subunit